MRCAACLGTLIFRFQAPCRDLFVLNSMASFLTCTINDRTLGHDIRIPLFAGVAYVVVILSLQVTSLPIAPPLRPECAVMTPPVQALPQLTLSSGQRFMRNRKALELKGVSAVHNGALSLFSLMVFVGQAYETVLAVNVRRRPSECVPAV